MSELSCKFRCQRLTIETPGLGNVPINNALKRGYKDRFLKEIPIQSREQPFRPPLIDEIGKPPIRAGIDIDS